MAEASPDSVLMKILGPAIGTAIGWLLGLLPGGLTGSLASPLTALFGVAGGVSGLIFSLMYKRYLGVLGASVHPKDTTDRDGKAERKAYDGLRKSLRGDNIATRLYSDSLTTFLDAVDRFFGDASKADQTLFPHAFGLKTPAPLWTAPAFDRCLLLALLYPIAAVFIVWAVSGHIGPAEEALGLQRNLPGWMRMVAVMATGFSAFAYWRLVRASGWISAIVWFAVADSLTVAVAHAGAFPVAVAIAGAGIGVSAGAIAAGGVGVGVGIGAGAIAIAGAGAVAIAVVVIVVVVIVWLNERDAGNSRLGIFLLLFFIAMTSSCLVAAYLLAIAPNWHDKYGPSLLFLGLLTLLNAPFDWASLGLTRALLRRGLELKGWWPFLLAVADALAAAVIIALLSLTMVIGVQTFDALSIHAGGKPLLPLVFDSIYVHRAPQRVPLLDGIAAHPGAPEYWWVYALLLSTMIPSLLNLMIGGASLFRGVPGLPVLFLRFMPASGPVPSFNRELLALALTCQDFAGAFLGISAQLALAGGLLFHVLPWMGFGLLDTARAVAEYDLPTSVFGLWWDN